MQEQMQKRMAETRVEATAGGGMVTVVVNGTKQVLSIKIDPDVVSKDDVEMLQDLMWRRSTTRTAGSTSSLVSHAGHARRPEDPGTLLIPPCPS